MRTRCSLSAPPRLLTAVKSRGGFGIQIHREVLSISRKTEWLNDPRSGLMTHETCRRSIEITRPPARRGGGHRPRHGMTLLLTSSTEEESRKTSRPQGAGSSSWLLVFWFLVLVSWFLFLGPWFSCRVLSHRPAGAAAALLCVYACVYACVSSCLISCLCVCVCLPSSFRARAFLPRKVGEFMGRGADYMGGFCVKVLHAYVDGYVFFLCDERGLGSYSSPSLFLPPIVFVEEFYITKHIE